MANAAMNNSVPDLIVEVQFDGDPFCTWNDAVLMDSPLLYYRLGETAGTSAANSGSLASMSGTYTGGYTLNQNGALAPPAFNNEAGNNTETTGYDLDPSVLLNGSTGYVSLPTNATIDAISTDPSHAWTVEAWIYPTAVRSAAGECGIIARQFSSSHVPFTLAYGFSSPADTQGTFAGTCAAATGAQVWVGFYVTGDGWYQCADPAAFVTSGGDGVTTLNINQWYHYVGTWDSFGLTLYRNGVNVKTGVPTAGFTSAASSGLVTYVGKRWDSTGSTPYFPGQIDEVCVYNKALSATQVSAHFASQKVRISPTWTDISADVMAVQTQRGRTYELDAYQAGTATVVLDDALRNYDASNIDSPYNGGDVNHDWYRILPLRPIRIQAAANDLSNPDFETAGGYAAAVLAANPKLYWRMGESAGTIAHDSSGNSLNGTYDFGMTLDHSGSLPGDPATSAFSPGSPADTNENGGDIVSTYQPFAQGSNRTFMGWVYIDSNVTGGPVFFGGRPSGWTFGWLFNDGTTVAFSAGSTMTWASAWPGYNQWVHWTITYDDSTTTAELFINGVSKGTRTGTAYNIAGVNDVYVAGEADGLNGYMQEFAVFESILSSTQISNIYNAAISTEWVALSSATLINDNTNNVTGTQSLKVVTTATAGSGVRSEYVPMVWNRLESDVIVAHQVTQLNVSGRVYADSGANLTVAIVELNNSLTVLATGTITTVTGGSAAWTEFSERYTLQNSGTTQVYLEVINASAATATFHLDTVTVAPIWPIFQGFVDAWPETWEPPDYAITQITAADGFEPLTQAQMETSYLSPVPQGTAYTQMPELLNLAYWPRNMRYITHSDAADTTYTMASIDGSQGTDYALTILQDVANSEIGSFFMGKDGNAVFQDHDYRLNVYSALGDQGQFSDNEADLSNGALEYADMKTSFDQQYIVNDWTVSPDSSVTDPVNGRAVNTDSIRRYLRRTNTLSTRLASSSDCQKIADALVARTSTEVFAGGSVNPASILRIEYIIIEPLNSRDLWRQALQREISDEISVSRTPGGGVSGGFSGIFGGFYIEQISWNITVDAPWQVTWQLSPRAFSVNNHPFQLDASPYDNLDDTPQGHPYI